jgi:hypothetical protein
MVRARPGSTEWGLAQNKPSEPTPPEKGFPNCPECERVWNAYALAARKNLEAIISKEDATQTDEPEKMKILESEVRETTQWRAIARKDVTDHAATHARDKPETQQ